MRLLLALVFGLPLIFVVSGCNCLCLTMGAAPPAELKVMSFNIRYPNPGDGENYWPRRQERVVRTINDFGPDVLGVQEAVLEQAAYLDAELAGYTRIGVGRDDGDQQGEMTAVYYRADRFDLVDHGHFWLSDTPDAVASVGWDAALTRMATWLVLDDKAACNKLIVINTHFDHRGPQARIESAKLIRRRLTRLMNAYPGTPAVVMGDFNADSGSAPYRALFGDGAEPLLIDTYAYIHHASDQPDGTFNGFAGETGGDRIDWIVTTEGLRVLDASIVHTNDEGRYPSDHFPVTAALRFMD